MKKLDAETKDLENFYKKQNLPSAKFLIEKGKKIILQNSELNACLFKSRTEINNKWQNYKLKVLPFIESIPTMYSWAPLQKNMIVSSKSEYF